MYGFHVSPLQWFHVAQCLLNMLILNDTCHALVLPRVLLALAIRVVASTIWLVQPTHLFVISLKLQQAINFVYDLRLMGHSCHWNRLDELFNMMFCNVGTLNFWFFQILLDHGKIHNQRHEDATFKASSTELTPFVPILEFKKSYAFSLNSFVLSLNQGDGNFLEWN